MSDFRELIVPPAPPLDLGFSVQLHRDFRPIDVPAEERQKDFADPTACVPLLVTMANYGVIIFGAAGRPAFVEGTLQDWTWFFCKAQHFQVHAMGAALVGGQACILADVAQDAEAGRLRLRVAGLEDGGRLVLLSVMAPELVWDAAQAPLMTMLNSFRIHDPRGRTARLTPDDRAPA